MENKQNAFQITYGHFVVSDQLIAQALPQQSIATNETSKQTPLQVQFEVSAVGMNPLPTSPPENNSQPSTLNTALGSGFQATRTRIEFTRGQLLDLEAEYKENVYLQKAQRLRIADRLRLTEKNVAVWFQNRRRRAKKEKLSKENTHSMKRYVPSKGGNTLASFFSPGAAVGRPARGLSAVSYHTTSHRVPFGQPPPPYQSPKPSPHKVQHQAPHHPMESQQSNHHQSSHQFLHQQKFQLPYHQHLQSSPVQYHQELEAPLHAHLQWPGCQSLTQSRIQQPQDQQLETHQQQDKQPDQCNNSCGFYQQEQPQNNLNIQCHIQFRNPCQHQQQLQGISHQEQLQLMQQQAEIDPPRQVQYKQQELLYHEEHKHHEEVASLIGLWDQEESPQKLANSHQEHPHIDFNAKSDEEMKEHAIETYLSLIEGTSCHLSPPARDIPTIVNILRENTEFSNPFNEPPYV